MSQPKRAGRTLLQHHTLLLAFFSQDSLLQSYIHGMTVGSGITSTFTGTAAFQTQRSGTSFEHSNPESSSSDARAMPRSAEYVVERQREDAVHQYPVTRSMWGGVSSSRVGRASCGMQCVALRKKDVCRDLRPSCHAEGL